MTTGTKSLLFGVHQFLWHPYTVWRGWRKLYGRNPGFWISIAIIVHDWGYWGCERMDDERGEQHPIFGAKLLAKLYIWSQRLQFWKQIDGLEVLFLAAELFSFCKYHSRYLSAANHVEPSRLCWADKLSPAYDPPWFYLLRARLSGELAEYRSNAKDHITAGWSDKQWYLWLTAKCKEDAFLKRKATHRTHENKNHTILH